MARTLAARVLRRVVATEEARRRLYRIVRPVRFGSLRRPRPISDRWGLERGTPVDRHYIEAFLGRYGSVIRGRVLEVGDPRYARRFGSDLELVDVVDIRPDNRQATIVADLAAADDIPDDRYDCLIVTQVLQYVSDPVRAVRHLHRMLAPGGTLLATVPVLSRIGRHDLGLDLWRFTPAGAQRLFAEAFGAGNIEVHGHGNSLAGVAFITGAAAEDLRPAELAVDDPHSPVVVTIVARKPLRGSGAGDARPSRS